MLETYTESVMHEFGVIIGQFQPFTNTHYELVKFALSKAKTVILIIGSDCQARTIENPWTTVERTEMVQRAFINDLDILSRIHIRSAKDYLYNENLWITQIQAKVEDATDGSKDVVLFGFKERPSHYSTMFPQWEFIDAEDHVSDLLGVPPAAEHVRSMYFTLDLLDIKRHVQPLVFEALNKDMMDGPSPRPTFMALKDEYEFIQDYKAQWGEKPFKPTFETVDAVCIKSGHVLVVRRRSTPGRGLIALPGGFLNQEERCFEASVRELKEETGIKLTKQELASSFREMQVFDHPKRSLRGRTITHAYCFNLGQGDLPKVKGDDDADKAWWMSLRDVQSSEDKFFEDHFHIINHFVNRF